MGTLPETFICPVLPKACDGYQTRCAKRCRHSLVAPIDALHFVGFRDPRFYKDFRYDNAVRVFGEPDIIHRIWDHRARAEVAEHDVVVFASGDENSPVCEFGWDDSHDDIIRRGGASER